MEQPPPFPSATPLAPAQVAALLAATAASIQATIKALPLVVLTRRPRPGEWCAQEVLGHLIVAEERGFAGRIRAIPEEELPRFSGWDPDGAANARRDAERDPAEVLGECICRRAAGVDRVERVTATDLERGGDHPEARFLTINDPLHEWVHHNANRVRQLLGNVPAHAWPGMGHGQRFSMPEDMEPAREA